jgi:hypothetical protein
VQVTHPVVGSRQTKTASTGYIEIFKATTIPEANWFKVLRKQKAHQSGWAFHIETMEREWRLELSTYTLAGEHPNSSNSASPILNFTSREEVTFYPNK